MDIRRLEYFVKVAETQSFSKAAAALRLAQSTLSRQIIELEISVGQRLLLRTGRGATPTEAGHALLTHARAILSIARHAQQELTDLDATPRGRVAVGLPSLMALRCGGALVKAFRAKFPNALLTLTEGLSLNLREWLLDGRIDVALLYDPPVLPQLEYTVLCREPLALIAPRDAPKLPATVMLTTLPRYPLVLPSAPNAIRSLVDEALRAKGVQLQVIAEVAAAPTLLSLVAQGVGYTILPDSAVQTPAGLGNLQFARLGGPAIYNRVTLALPTTRPTTRLVREIVSILGQIVRPAAPSVDAAK